MSRGPRYRFVLVQEPGTTLPVRYRRRRPFVPLWVRRSDPLEALIEAFLKLDRRGEGQAAWAPVLSDNPLSFLLDALGDAVVVRYDDGRLAYANPAARQLEGLLDDEDGPHGALEQLQLGHRRYERRCMRFGRAGSALVLEVLRRLE